MAKYEIRDVVCDYGIYEDGELKLILESRTNAEYIKAILEVDGSRPNAATVYSPVVEEMSEEEVLAVFSLCIDGAHQCSECPLRGYGGAGECFAALDRRVLAMAERALKPSSARCDCEKQCEEGASEDDEKKQIEEMRKVKEVAVACDSITAKCKWDKIYVLCPHGIFVDDHTRYMAFGGMKERRELFDILCKNIKDSGNWEKVTILDGGYWENFQKIVNDIKEIMKNGKAD